VDPLKDLAAAEAGMPEALERVFQLVQLEFRDVGSDLGDHRSRGPPCPAQTLESMTRQSFSEAECSLYYVG
jgi:hypothetical protein